MPELPEVETIRRALRDGGRAGPSVLDRTVVAGRCLWHGSLAFPDARRFWQRLRGRRIMALRRRGKFLLIELEGPRTLAVHLRMSGDLTAEPDRGPLPRFTRFWARLSGDVRLVFSDPRKFGRLWLLDDPAELLGSLGPEPLERALTKTAFAGRLLTRRRQLKAWATSTPTRPFTPPACTPSGRPLP
jgi:formamidopyrimidine-DNA glycosylase